MLQVQDVEVTQKIIPRLETKKRRPLLTLLEEDDTTPTYRYRLNKKTWTEAALLTIAVSSPAPIVFIA